MNESPSPKKIDIVQLVGGVVCAALLFYSCKAQQKNTNAPAANPVVQQPVVATPVTVPTAPGAKAADVVAEESLSVAAVTQPLAVTQDAPVELIRGKEIFRLDPKGAGILSVLRNDYSLNPGSDEKVKLGNWDYPFLGFKMKGANLWKVMEPSVNDAKNQMTLNRVSPDGMVQMTECWDVSSAQESEVLYTVTFSNRGTAPVNLQELRVEGGAIAPSVSPNRKASRGESTGGLFLGRPEGKVKEYDPAKLRKKALEDAAALQLTATSWMAIHSKYFVLACWPREGAAFSGVEAASVPAEPAEMASLTAEQAEGRMRSHVRGIFPDLLLQPGESRTFSLVGYVGPKKYERLHAIGNGVERVMQMDMFLFWHPSWMGWISRYLLKILVWLSPFTGWGMAVILLTLFLKLLFFPLSHKSMVSMRKMSALKPELDKIREQYKDNPQLMFQKQRELQQKHGVSTMGGCLPMLCQIPVFFALFNMFRNAIELRQASFLWAADLSLPDTLSCITLFPVRPFAILMAAGMILQQKMSPSADPQQGKMMLFMSVFFAFIFYNMPSALTLYLTVTYLLGCLQTWMVNRLMPSPSTVVDVVDVATKKR